MCGRYSITLPPEAIREIFQTHGRCKDRCGGDEAGE
jgi:hypothetical protein